jgi:hypothetical protein
MTLAPERTPRCSQSDNVVTRQRTVAYARGTEAFSSGGAMDDERDKRPNGDDAARWRQICLRFHDLRRGAREFGLDGSLEKLTKDPVGDLAGWLELDKQIQIKKEQTLGVAMPMIDLAADLSKQGIGYGDDRPRPYVCPDHRCTRRDPALFGEPPSCDLLDREMIKEDGEPD